MAIGTITQDVFELENIKGWLFVCNDARITDITGWTITLVIKANPLAVGSALLGPYTATIVSSQSFSFDMVANLAPGSYTYSVRRMDTGYVWQLAQGSFIVEASAHVTH